MLHCRIGLVVLSLFFAGASAFAQSFPYPIVDTGQDACFDNSRQIKCPEPGTRFNGEDAQYKGNAPAYRDNGDGTVTDLVTGLMWVKARGNKQDWPQAMAGAGQCRVGGYSDWRAPTIKELYSLMNFNGWEQRDEATSTPFIDTRYFEFRYGNTRSGERIIDCQDWSATEYRGTTMGGAATIFGVNFADGRIKGYPKTSRRKGMNKYIRYVRGNPDYGKNIFKDTKSGTVKDEATGLIWQKQDDGKIRNWEQALGYCENLSRGGRSDWRLPSAKELQSIVDYTRSPTSTNSAAIDPIFSVTEIESYFWTSTTHMDGPKPNGAAYVAFGRAMGYFSPPKSSAAKRFLDVHGAGAQRSDPKVGDPKKYPTGHGPQGDDIRIYNFVRCVAGGGVEYYEPPFKLIGLWKGGGARNDSGGGIQSRPGKQGGPGMQSETGQGRRQGPPPEASKACSNKLQGDDCSFETHHGVMSGLCRDMRGQVVCVPERGASVPRQ